MEQNKTMTASAEDYLEAIFILSRQGGNAHVRVTDLAAFLSVSKPSVTHAVGTLKEKGLLEHEAYGSIRLTPAGESCAANVLRRHKMIERFLMHIGVSAENAEADACRMEHILSAETMEKMYAYLEQQTLQAEETL